MGRWLGGEQWGDRLWFAVAQAVYAEPNFFSEPGGYASLDKQWRRFGVSSERSPINLSCFWLPTLL